MKKLRMYLFFDIEKIRLEIGGLIKEERSSQHVLVELDSKMADEFGNMQIGEIIDFKALTNDNKEVFKAFKLSRIFNGELYFEEYFDSDKKYSDLAISSGK